MKPEEWKQVEAAYADGLTLPLPKRLEFWQSKFTDNPPLRAELDLLIRGEQKAASVGFLDQPAWSLALLNDTPTEDENIKATGKIIGNYEIIAAIGKGGMGEVYLAKDKKLGREVALKILRDALNRDSVARFQDEMRILCKIEHDNVARLYDGGMDEEGRPFIVMEYLRDFVSLRDFQRQTQNRGLPLDQIKAITRQFCIGLAQAHDKGIVHRDIKPENIMLINDRDGLRVKVIDFGVAIAPAFTTEEMNQGILTHRPSVFSPGTTVYKSPEQLENKPREQIKPTSDVYSFALVVYEMLTGRLAFPSEVHRIHEQAFPSASSLRPGLGNQIDAVIRRAVSNNPEERQPDIRTLANELIAALPESAPPANETIIPKSTETTEDLEAETAVRKPVDADAETSDAAQTEELSQRRNRGLMIGILLMAVLAAGLGWGAWSMRNRFEALPENVSSSQASSTTAENGGNSANLSPVAASPDTTAQALSNDAQQMKLALFRNRQTVPTGLNTIWRNGDSVKFKLSFDQPGYLYVLNHGSNSLLEVLFPHHTVNNGNNRVLANQRLEIPPVGSTPFGGFRLDDQPGVETFYFIFVPNDNEQDELLSPVKTAIRQLGNKPEFAVLDLQKLGGWFNQLRAKANALDQQNQKAVTDAEGNLLFKGSGILVKSVGLEHTPDVK